MIPKAVAPAYSAGAPYKVTSRSQRQSAYSADAAEPLRRNAGDDLFKPHALPTRYILRPTEGEIERYVDSCLADEIADPRTQLRNVHIEELSTTLIDPPQMEHFAVPPDQTWNPSCACNAEDEDGDTFHLQLEKTNDIPVRRWQTNPALQDPNMITIIRALSQMRIYSFGHMILATWAVYLYSQDDRLKYIVVFLYRLLQTNDWDEAIPALLVEFQPRMVDEDTTAIWPSYNNFKCAADRWVCCCKRAFRYLFDHLTGPIEWHPRWLQTDNVPADLRVEIRDTLIGTAQIVFNNLRHLVYRQYGLRHIQATLERTTVSWRRLDKIKNRETTRNGSCLDYETIVFAETPVYNAFRARLRPEVFMVQVPEGDRSATRRLILNCFPGPRVRRVVFWIGRNYIVNGNRDDYDELIQDLCHAYSAYSSFVEQFVILPPYIRTHRGLWTSRALRLLVQQQDVVPYARVTVYPEDLQLYDRDRRLGATSTWRPSFPVTTDGSYATAETIEGRKTYLKDEHDLNLWESYVDLSAIVPPPLLDYSSVPAKDTAKEVATYSVAPPQQPTTSANIAAANAKASLPAVIPPAAGTTQPASTAIVPTDLGTSSATAAPDTNAIIQTAVTTFFQQQQQSTQHLAQLLTQLLGATTATTEETKKSRARKDHKKDRRE